MDITDRIYVTHAAAQTEKWLWLSGKCSQLSGWMKQWPAPLEHPDFEHSHWFHSSFIFSSISLFRAVSKCFLPRWCFFYEQLVLMNTPTQSNDTWQTFDFFNFLYRLLSLLSSLPSLLLSSDWFSVPDSSLDFFFALYTWGKVVHISRYLHCTRTLVSFASILTLTAGSFGSNACASKNL